MKIFKESMLDKKYVHKFNEENVLICNLRRSIPTFIEKETVEKVIFPDLNDSQKSFFLEYYTPHKFDSTNLGKEGYILFNIPHTIDSKIIDGNDKAYSISNKDRNVLLEYYSKDSKSNIYVLKSHLSELEGKRIQKILGLKDIGISNKERMILSEMFENIKEFNKENIFYANMIINPEHPFFFEHPQDHVPGMMMLEAARQFSIACCHIYGKVTVENTQIILNQLKANFFDYLDLHYPVEMKNELKDYRANNEGKWEYVFFQVDVYQRGFLCNQCTLEGRIISKKLFNRLRKGKDAIDTPHRFYLVGGSNYNASFWSREHDKYITFNLLDISHEGFCVEMEENLEEITKSRIFEFFVFFSRIGFICGECCLKWISEEGGKIFAGCHITKITKSNRNNLKEAIRQYCYLKVDRERV